MRLSYEIHDRHATEYSNQLLAGTDAEPVESCCKKMHMQCLIN